MVDLSKLEMVICPICGKPFPKKRQELGYNYCVNCSSESRVAALIEGTMDGEDCQTTVQVISRAEAIAIEKALRGDRGVDTNSEYEDMPDMNSFEEQDEYRESSDEGLHQEDRYSNISDEDLKLLSEQIEDDDSGIDDDSEDMDEEEEY